jgi:ketosteroid isomerase-like protein
MDLTRRGPDGLTPIERSVARDEIRQLAFRYAWALDSRDVDTLVSLYVPDVRVSRDEWGPAAFRHFWDRTLRALGVTVLQVGNHVVDFDDPTRARGVVYCRGLVQEAGRVIDQAIVYFDTYEERGGRWLFVTRRHELFFGVETALDPYDQPDANWPASNAGRGTLPWNLPSWQAFDGGEPPTG